MQTNRRRFLRLIAAAGVSTGVSGGLRSTSVADIPMTGDATREFDGLDGTIASFLTEHDVPGASLAVTRGGKLVYARGFGYADRDAKQPVESKSLFRIASVSKPLTAVAVLQLVEDGKLGLRDLAFDRIGPDYAEAVAGAKDPRIRQITVLHCLQHTGGWDRSASRDLIAFPREIAATLNVPTPPTSRQIVQYLTQTALDFAPGEKHAYSNVGYLVLGRIIEAVTGMAYEDYVKTSVLKRVGIHTAGLGRAQLEHRLPDEVRYYNRTNKTGPSLYDPAKKIQVPVQYGYDNLEGYDAHGGWVATPTQLVRFASDFDGVRAPRLLKVATVRTMWERPEGRAGRDDKGQPSASYYGCGWNVRPVAATNSGNAWHAGFIVGTESMLMRLHDGIDWAILLNKAQTADGQSLTGILDSVVNGHLSKIARWPSTDLFRKHLT